MNPLVSVVMLSSPGREQMRERAIRSFDAQTYQPRDLIVLPAVAGATIGEMRNRAVELASGEIIAHFDDDDISAPQRIEEQVALLQSSGADCVGYYEAPFYDQRPGQFAGTWMYRDPARRAVLGASLCYWRKTWERNHFDNVNVGEDARFAQRCKTVAASAMESEPRLICGVHGSNTSPGYNFAKRMQCFKRAPEWDEWCRERMAL